MALQTTINGSLVAGIVGEFSDNSPKTARAYLVRKSAANKLPTFGTLMTFGDEVADASTATKRNIATQGVAADKTVGILVNPKEHYVVGFKTGRTIEDGTVATVASRGHIWVMATTSVAAGDPVYCTAEGVLKGEKVTGEFLVNGAKWLRTATLSSDKSEVLAEVAIDMPTITVNA